MSTGIPLQNCNYSGKLYRKHNGINHVFIVNVDCAVLFAQLQTSQDNHLLGEYIGIC